MAHSRLHSRAELVAGRLTLGWTLAFQTHRDKRQIVCFITAYGLKKIYERSTFSPINCEKKKFSTGSQSGQNVAFQLKGQVQQTTAWQFLVLCLTLNRSNHYFILLQRKNIHNGGYYFFINILYLSHYPCCSREL